MKALICLLEADSLAPYPDLAEQLDEVARLGCGGQLVWRSSTKGDSLIPPKAFAMKQILGFSMPKYISAPMSARFGQMKVAFLSPESDLFTHLQAHELSLVEHVADTQTSEDIFSTIKRHILLVGEKKEDACDVVILHLPLTSNQSSVSNIRNVATLKSLLELILKGKAEELYFSAVLTNPLATYNPHESEPAQETSGKYKPLQSYQLFEDSIIDTSSFAPASAIYYMPDVTRTDRMERFTHEECARKGANNRILVDQYLSEIAFKLGFTPKYGA